jgi:hypothetical protein
MSFFIINKTAWALLIQLLQTVTKFQTHAKAHFCRDVKKIEDLNDLERLFKHKRNDKSKKERHNLHYVKVLIKTRLKGADFED